MSARKREYAARLKAGPDCPQMVGRTVVAVDRRALLDAFIYTRYAHQPNAKGRRQYADCLAALDSDEVGLTWLFLSELWHCSLDMFNTGVCVADFYRWYTADTGRMGRVLAALPTQNPGIGTLEKKADRDARLVREKVQELAAALWEQAGRPEGGPAQFSAQAATSLAPATG